MIAKKLVTCLLFVLILVFPFLSGGCASGQRNTSAKDSLLVYPTRVFFGEMRYTMESNEVASGMRNLEDLLYERFPSEKLTDDGEVPEEYLGGAYRDASQGDRHITLEEFMVYQDSFLQAVESGLPDPLRVVQRRRER